MTTHRITDEQATALLEGRAPDGREDLERVSEMLGTLRLASFEPPPQPSAALAARLDLDRLAWVAAARGAGTPSCDTKATTVLPSRPATGGVRKVLGWFTGLGIAAQLALGAGAVSASAAGIGLAGALPPAAQDVFDAVVATVVHADELPAGTPGDEPAPAPGKTDDTTTGGEDAGTGSSAGGTPTPAEKRTAADTGAQPGAGNGDGIPNADDREPDRRGGGAGAGGTRDAADRAAPQRTDPPAPARESRAHPQADQVPARKTEDADARGGGAPASGENGPRADRNGGSTGGAGDAPDAPAEPTSDTAPGGSGAERGSQ